MYRKNNRLNSTLYIGRTYFITICSFEKQCIFGEIVEEPLRFHNSEIGKIIQENWQNLPNLFSDIILLDFVVMPNHFHAIIEIGLNSKYKNNDKIQNLSNIVAVFKSLSWKAIYGTARVPLQIHKQIWQKSFHDHIIRDEQSLQIIQKYIQNKPLSWHLDSINPNNNKL